MYAILSKVSCSSGSGGAIDGKCAVRQIKGTKEHNKVSNKTDTDPETAI